MPLAGQRIKASDLDAPVTQVRQITTGQSIPNNAYTAVTFNFEDLDDDNMHDLVTNTSRLTAKRAGRYEVSGGVSWTANATGRRGLIWTVNGTSVQGSQVIAPVGGSTAVEMNARTMILVLAVNDYIELRAYQDSTAALSTTVVSPSGAHAYAKYLGTGA